MARSKFTTEEIAEKKSQLAELRRLRAMGAKQVSHGDKTVVLKSDAELHQAIEDLERDLRGAYDTISSNIVGTGIRALSKAEDKEIRRQITDVTF